MHRLTLSVPANVIPALAVVAIVGYLLGVHRPPAAPASASAEKTRIASGASILLEYPPGWQAAATAPAIPGLSLTRPLVLAPDGDSTLAGLISGRLPAATGEPLPAGLLKLTRGLPHSEVVDLANAQAYRYSGLRLPGYDKALALYVVPSAGEGQTVLACYATSALSSYLRQCEQIVAQLTPGAQSQYDLSPDGAYAGRLDALVALLARERLTLRAAMHVRRAPVALARLARALAQRFATTAASLRALEAPVAAAGAQAALYGTILQAGDAYRALAAATGGSAIEYKAAQGQIEKAEGAVNTALEGFSLLGYDGM